MNIRKWVKLALLFSAVAVLGIVVPVTLSYVFDVTAPVVNTFVPPAGLHDENAVEILVDKTVRNTGDAAITPEGFTFLLENVATGETFTAVSNKDGRARIVLSFSGAQVGSHTFCLTEQNDGLEGVTYSTAEYIIRVDVALVDEKLAMTVYQDGQLVEKVAAAFENIYHHEEIPDTGDETPMAVFVVLMAVSGALLILLARKRRNA